MKISKLLTIAGITLASLLPLKNYGQEYTVFFNDEDAQNDKSLQEWHEDADKTDSLSLDYIVNQLKSFQGVNKVEIKRDKDVTSIDVYMSNKLFQTFSYIDSNQDNYAECAITTSHVNNGHTTKLLDINKDKKFDYMIIEDQDLKRIFVNEKKKGLYFTKVIMNKK